MDLGNEVGCDFCEHTSKDPGRAIYVCEDCGADVCSDCSETVDGQVLCCPAQSCYPSGCAARTQGIEEAEAE